MLKKLLSTMTALCMILGTAATLPEGIVDGCFLTISAKAAYSGYCGLSGNDTDHRYNGSICCSDVAWTLDSEGTLIISGNGRMTDFNTDPEYFYSHDYDYGWSQDIKKVIINEGVTSIGDGAFSNCHKLTSVSLPSSIVKIGNEAFYRCDSLKTINLPSGITNIGYHSFYGCNSLERISIPESVTDIREGAFLYTPWLKTQRTNNPLVVVNNILIDGSTCDGDVVIPNTVVKICDRAFEIDNSNEVESKIDSIVISNSITSIGRATLSGCYNLKCITILNNATIIDTKAFDHCHRLENIIVEDNSEYSFVDGILYNKEKTEIICVAQGIKNLIILDGITSLPVGAFRYAKSIYIPKSVDFLEPFDIGYYQYDAGETTDSEKIDGFTIYCYSGTAAEQYAKRYNVYYELLDQHIHTHFYSTKITKYATCSADGLKTYTCACGDTYTETIPKTAHKYTEKVIAPTTTAQGYTLHTCSVCGARYKDNYTDKVHTHNYTSQVTRTATCAATGIRTYTCSCGDSYTEIIPLAEHNYTAKTVAPTYTAQGYTQHTCSVCGDSYKDTYTAKLTPKAESISKATVTGISAKTYTGKAITQSPVVKLSGKTLKAGTDYTVAYKNNTKVGTATVTITGKGSYTGTISKTFKINTASIAKAAVSGISNKTYTGKAITQNPTVKLSSTTLKKGTDYTVTFKNNKAVGTATVTIKGKGNYTGTISKTFKINPKKTTLKTATSPKTKKLKVTYSKVSGVTGYQTVYSTSSKFTKATTKTASSKSTSKTISGLTKGKTYYVKVRTYKTVKGTKYYSGYSAVKKIKIK